MVFRRRRRHPVLTRRTTAPVAGASCWLRQSCSQSIKTHPARKSVMSSGWALLAAGIVLVAGCFGATSEPKPDDEGLDNFDDLDLDASEDTGIIRGVVVDE